MNFKSYIFGLIILFLCSCSPTLLGKLKNDIYTSPKGKFSLPVPVDLSRGGNGSIADGDDHVTFTYLVDGVYSIKSFSHSEHVTPENRQSMTKEALIKFVDPSQTVLYEEYIPSIKNGATFIAYADSDAREGDPNVIGVGGFWTETRFILVLALESRTALILRKDKSEKTQIMMVKRLLIDVLNTIDVEDVKGGPLGIQMRGQ